MNHHQPINPKMTNGVLIILFVTGAILISNPATAQQVSRPGQRFYAGVEGSIGTRSFTMKSDIEAIDHMAVSAEGGSFGIVFGSKVFHTRLKQGYFKSSSSIAEKFGVMESSGSINLYPLQLNKMKFRYFEPYFLMGADRNTVKLYGEYVTITPGGGTLGAGNGTGTGTGTGTGHDGTIICGAGGPPIPDDGEGTLPTDPNENPEAGLGQSEQTDSAPYLGKLVSTRANVGLGLECHIPGLHHFINLFAEAKYGIPVNKSVSDVVFKNTKASGSLAISFGVSFGFSH